MEGLLGPKENSPNDTPDPWGIAPGPSASAAHLRKCTGPERGPHQAVAKRKARPHASASGHTELHLSHCPQRGAAPEG